jgi:AmmeMemoRadiSam system protein B
MTARPTAIRPPCAAGRFYSDDPERLLTELDALLTAARSSEDVPGPLAIVSPHAGYRYSGPVAASAFEQLRSRRAMVRQVVILGPAHFTRLPGMALPRWDAFDTPLGALRIAEPARALAAALPHVLLSDAAHHGEHSIEVQLPFLQRVLGPQVEIVPVVVGQVQADRVADLIDALWQDESTAVIISTDLSHYHDQTTTRRLDRRTADAILRRDPTAIGDHDACGHHALRGLLELTRRRDLRVRQLDLRTSADTAGGKSRVVGYGAFATYST